MANAPVTTGSCWRHRNGFTYIVLAITNDTENPRPNYPPTVFYINRDGKPWTGRLDDWHRRMEPIEGDEGLYRAAREWASALLHTSFQIEG